ncbi:MAG TPA: HlyD family efflux transporter periplasmic adaptor subunit, partial [Steroidobacteraceae bacterium]|nr:HlyD family efflux transporter periplasmic adaptor subunit [Steroidobacteraceae bacterium]
PVVVLLPPGNVKARVYVSQTQLGRFQLGGPGEIRIDGREQPIDGKISFISPTLEFTPPVVYSREMRDKFVSLVEIIFASSDAATLHPGQPVDVSFSTSSK